jgi:acetate kinase
MLLTVNPGSSSIRLHLFDLGASAPRAIDAFHGPRQAGREQRLLERFMRSSGGVPNAVAHRVVHPGLDLQGNRLIDPATGRRLRAAIPLAPLHLPDTLAWIAAVRKVLGAKTRQCAVFDSTFFARLPPEASTYGLPRSLVGRHRIRRIGFHGIAHGAMLMRWRQQQPGHRLPRRIVTLQLGAGCSAAAILDGHAIDTSMGMTPAEGLLMATRAGDIDPGIPLYLQRQAGLSHRAVESLLNSRSGLRGIAGTADMRRLLTRSDASARLAVAVYCYRARKYLGAYAAALGGLDCILIGGGVGEHAVRIRERILSGFEWLGLAIDARRNRAVGDGPRVISRSSSRVAAWVMPVDEAAEIARQAVAVLGARAD